MGTITINIEDEFEKEFMELAKQYKGDKKDYLDKAVNEAMKNWIEEKKQQEITKR